MPLTNRVHPDGSLHAVSARGSMMGNRGGRIHDPETRLLGGKKRWASKAWICCVLSFKGRQRSVWGNGYTELFFLDEVTALTAGHRPCFECRRADALRFQQAFQAAMGDAGIGGTALRAGEMDTILHKARLGPTKQPMAYRNLPVGAIARFDNTVIAKGQSGPLQWTFDGYAAMESFDMRQRGLVLTPAPILAILEAGYRPHWHPSAENLVQQ